MGKQCLLFWMALESEAEGTDEYRSTRFKEERG